MKGDDLTGNAKDIRMNGSLWKDSFCPCCKIHMTDSQTFITVWAFV